MEKIAQGHGRNAESAGSQFPVRMDGRTVSLLPVRSGPLAFRSTGTPFAASAKPASPDIRSAKAHVAAEGRRLLRAARRLVRAVPNPGDCELRPKT